MMTPSLNRVLAAVLLAFALDAGAYTTNFFNATQTAAVTLSNIDSVTIRSGEYLFTYSQDGYWSPYQGGAPTGRFFSVFWPNGVQAQAITAGPNSGAGANITLTRADGKPFDLQAFTGKLLANTAGAGGAFEIMPSLKGQDAFQNPLQYDATGYAGNSFPHTPALSGYDTYTIHLWTDWALTALTLVDTNPIVPPAPSFTVTTALTPVGAGSVTGAGSYPSNTTCSLSATPAAGWGFQKWTRNGTQVSTSANYNFTVRSNVTLIANFVPAFTVTNTAYPDYAGTATGNGTFNSNSTVTVRATPASGFQFVNWTDSGSPVSTATNYSFAINADHYFTANFAPLPQTVVFDFDSGTPVLSQGGGLPGSLTKNGLTLSFTTTGGGWSMQSRQSSIVGAPPVFSGLFLYPSTWGSTLKIQFSEPVTDFNFDFMTGELAADYDIAGTMRVTAYTNSTATPAVGVGTAQGAWLHGSYPEGHLNFHSATPFTIVTVDMAPIATPSGLFFLDNLIVERAAVPTNFVVATSSSPANGGTTSGDGNYHIGSNATVHASAAAGFVFLDWFDVNAGVVVSTNADYTFASSSDVTLIAEFAALWNVVTLAAPAAAGSVTPGGTFLDGSLVTLTATPNAGCVFVDWLEDGMPVSYAATFDYYVWTNATLTAEFISNAPPVAVADNVTRTQHFSLKIKLADLLANDYDPDGDWFDVIDVSVATTNGIPLTWDATNVYFPATNSVAADEFSYTIMDAWGQTATTTVTVTAVAPPPAQAKSIAGLTGNSATVNFFGIPGYTYIAQRSTDMTHWVNIRTNVAPAAGAFSVQDNFTDLGGVAPGSAFYRLQAQ